MFDEYFANYNQQINEENARVSGTGYADIKKKLRRSNKILFLSPLPTELEIFMYTSDYYIINKVLCSSGVTFKGQAERVSQGKITLLNNSLLTAPSVNFPAYTQQANLITIFPSTFNGANDIEAQYIRYPLDPKWTFSVISTGDPMLTKAKQTIKILNCLEMMPIT